MRAEGFSFKGFVTSAGIVNICYKTVNYYNPLLLNFWGGLDAIK